MPIAGDGCAANAGGMALLGGDKIVGFICTMVDAEIASNRLSLLNKE